MDCSVIVCSLAQWSFLSVFSLCKRRDAPQMNCHWPTALWSMRRSCRLNSWVGVWLMAIDPCCLLILSPLLPLSYFRHVTVRNSAHKYVFTLKTHPGVNAGTIGFSLPQVSVHVSSVISVTSECWLFSACHKEWWWFVCLWTLHEAQCGSQPVCYCFSSSNPSACNWAAATVHRYDCNLRHHRSPSPVFQWWTTYWNKKLFHASRIPACNWHPLPPLPYRENGQACRLDRTLKVSLKGIICRLKVKTSLSQSYHPLTDAVQLQDIMTELTN